MAIIIKILLIVMLMCSLSDAKGGRGGGKGGGFGISTGNRGSGSSIKVPSISKTSVRGPFVPIIILPVGRYRHQRNRNTYRQTNLPGLQCFKCESDENGPCAKVNSFGNYKVSCGRSEYCSTIRKEILVTESFVSNSGSNASITNNSMIVQTNIPSSNGSDQHSSISSSVKKDSVNSTTLNIITRQVTRVVIERGCKTYDFIQGALLGSSGSSGNATGKVYAQLCTTDLCNSGDGRLRCYECSGTGSNHDCMRNVTNVAKKVMCQADEACYVERKQLTTFSKSLNKTVTHGTVSRGCRAASSSDDTDTIINTNGTLKMSCRLDELCNSFNANLMLMRLNSAAGITGTLASVILTSLIAFLLQW